MAAFRVPEQNQDEPGPVLVEFSRSKYEPPRDREWAGPLWRAFPSEGEATRTNTVVAALICPVVGSLWQRDTQGALVVLVHAELEVSPAGDSELGIKSIRRGAPDSEAHEDLVMLASAATVRPKRGRDVVQADRHNSRESMRKAGGVG